MAIAGQIYSTTPIRLSRKCTTGRGILFGEPSEPQKCCHKFEDELQSQSGQKVEGSFKVVEQM